MQRSTSLDLVICTYNNAALLDRCLQAISRQRLAEHAQWQVLVVNNNCTDATAQVVERHAASMPVPLTMVFESRQGLTPARVCGVKHSQAEWIAFIDDDCLLAEDWVENAAAFAREHPDCGAFGGRVILEWETSPPPYVEGYGYAYAETDLGEAAQRRDWLAGAGMVLRRAALEATGWVEHQFLDDRIGKRLVSGGDVEIGMRVAAHNEVWYAPRCRLQHVIPARRTSRQYLRRLVFGLGMCGHNTGALAWSGSYSGWFVDAARQSLRFLDQALRQIARHAVWHRPALDIGLALSFVLGWWSAMWHMLWARRSVRQRLLGGITDRHRAA